MLPRISTCPFLHSEAIPFTEDRKYETALLEREGRAVWVIKGAPETVLSKSTLSPEERVQWLNRIESWAREGHRVLGVGAQETVPQVFEKGDELTEGFRFSGLLAFEDPARPEVREAI
jgi:Ca2+-transporting ATPase